MKARLAGAFLSQIIHRHGLAATVLDYFVLPFIAEHPREPTTAGGTNTIKTDTLRQLVREGKLSKAVQLARMKYDAEERGLPAMAKPTRDHIARTVRDKFPAMAAANAIPTHEQLPRMHWRSMRSTGAPTTQRSWGRSAPASEPSQPDCGQRLSETCWRV